MLLISDISVSAKGDSADQVSHGCQKQQANTAVGISHAVPRVFHRGQFSPSHSQSFSHSARDHIENLSKMAC